MTHGFNIGDRAMLLRSRLYTGTDAFQCTHCDTCNQVHVLWKTWSSLHNVRVVSKFAQWDRRIQVHVMRRMQWSLHGVTDVIKKCNTCNQADVMWQMQSSLHNPADVTMSISCDRRSWVYIKQHRSLARLTTSFASASASVFSMSRVSDAGCFIWQHITWLGMQIDCRDRITITQKDSWRKSVEEWGKLERYRGRNEQKYIYRKAGKTHLCNHY